MRRPTTSPFPAAVLALWAALLFLTAAPAAAADPVAPGTAFATVDGCTQITVTAPFSGDDNGNSTTTFRRGTSATGPWTDVCAGVSGPGPRTCVDTGALESSTYWYQIEFFDADGVDTTNAANPQVVGPFSTPPCTTDDTTSFTNSAFVSSCRQITVTNVFEGDADTDGNTEVQYRISPSGSWVTVCAGLTGPSPRQCIVAGNSDTSLDPDTYDVQVIMTDPDGQPVPNSEILGPFTLGTCGADAAAPTVLILSPFRNAVISGTEQVTVQVFDAGGLASTNPVQWWVDDDSPSTAVNENTNYGGTLFCASADGCRVFEFDINTSTLVNGSHRLTVEAIDAVTPTANRARVSQAFRVFNQGAGGQAGGAGLLLRRSHGSQLCNACHNIPTHSSQTTSTDYGNWAMGCLDCHDPHKTTNIFLIRENITTPHSGTAPVEFHYDDDEIGGEENPGDVPGDNPERLSFLGDRSQTDAGEPNAPYGDGVCEACHTRTKFWRNARSVGKHEHNAAVRCMKCHAHDEGFKGAGACLDCHSNPGDPGTETGRRPVLADFDNTTAGGEPRSHHVGNSSTFMGGSLTSHDCVVCHAEGAVDANNDVALTVWHNDAGCASGNNCIDLKDVDTWDDNDPGGSTVYSYDKDAVTASAGAASNWNSGNATWSTEMETAVDPFCLSCHDGDGALASRNQTDTECSVGGDASNPFCDGAITNEYDQYDRGGVTDIASRVADAWRVGPGGGAAYTAQERDVAGEGRYDEGDCGGTPGPGCNIDDPPLGVYSRHAIRGQTASVYTTQAIPNTEWEQTKVTWVDTSVMGCADCHVTDGANGSAGNAHGSDSEYLLKDRFGGATEGVLDPGTGTTDGTYNCYQCHNINSYEPGASHTGSGNNDYLDTTDQTGAARVTEGSPAGNIFGIACMNCHGGVLGKDGTPQFGTIHGTNQKFDFGPFDKKTGAPAGTREAYRFTNGNSLRFHNPQDWTQASATCYTLDKGDGDAFGGCVKHGSGQGHTRAVVRNLNY